MTRLTLRKVHAKPRHSSVTGTAPWPVSATWALAELPGLWLHRDHDAWMVLADAIFGNLLDAAVASDRLGLKPRSLGSSHVNDAALAALAPDYAELILAAEQGAQTLWLLDYEPTRELMIDTHGISRERYRASYQVWLVVHEQRFPTRREALQVLEAMMELHQGEPGEWA